LLAIPVLQNEDFLAAVQSSCFSLQVDVELERQKRELELDHQRRLAAIKEEAEAELRTQLRRQAAAHSDHLADVLTVQVGRSCAPSCAARLPHTATTWLTSLQSR
jgi:hypothetical protein